MTDPEVASAAASAHLKSQLEQRYIQLLEQRIADLEAILKKSAKKESSAGDEKDNDSAEKPIDSHKENKSEANAQKKLRIRRVIAKFDYKTGVRSDEDYDNKKKKENDMKKYEVTFRQVVQTSASEKDGFCEIDIRPGKLRELLRQQIGDYSGLSWEGDIVNIKTPFFPLVHHWTALENAAKEESADGDPMRDTREVLGELLAQIRDSPEMKPYFKTRESYLDARITTYETMWSLFVPGQFAYAKVFMRKPQLFIIDGAPWAADARKENRMFVSCWCYDWNGKEIVKVFYDIPIEQFRGSKPVNELSCYPLEYFEGDDEYENVDHLRQMLVKRGARYNCHVRERKGVRQMFEYNGEALAENWSALSKDKGADTVLTREDRLMLSQFYRLSRRREPEDRGGRKILANQGKYMVDAEAFLKYGGGSLILGDRAPDRVVENNIGDIRDIADQAKSKAERSNAESLADADWTADEKTYLLLLPPRFLGYSTPDKFWGQFSVDATSTVVKPKDDPFDEKLQLDQNYKNMIKSLIKHHAGQNDDTNSGRVFVKDPVEGKGRGLVILLHGPPGVGKTLTAETIAAATGKPLFVVSVAEIGLDASRAEKNLEQMFQLAGAWEAVLLVDEADVFLEARTTDNDAGRNALVSVLLRVLEYYNGIMILTTNRIRSLDVAVQSRIHLAVRYTDLQKEYKKKIFEDYIGQLKPECIDDLKEINSWIEDVGCEAELNGRQIRNIVSAALALARKENDGRVGKAQLKEVLAISNRFAKDLSSTTREARKANEAGG